VIICSVRDKTFDSAFQEKDDEWAIQPLEKLVELNPEREDYNKLLLELKKHTANHFD